METYEKYLSKETIKKIGVGIGAIFCIVGMVTIFAFAGNWFIFVSGCATTSSGLLHLYNNFSKK